jgi:hypothetical protein
MARGVWPVASADLSRRGFPGLRLAAARFGIRQGPTCCFAAALADFARFVFVTQDLSLKICHPQRAINARSFCCCVSTMQL